MCVLYDLFARFIFAVLVTEPAFPQYPTQYAGPALWEFATATVPLQTQPDLLPSKFAPVFMFLTFVCTNLMILPPVSYAFFAKFIFAVLVTEPAFPQYPTQYAGPALWEFATATVPLQTHPDLLPSKLDPEFKLLLFP